MKKPPKSKADASKTHLTAIGVLLADRLDAGDLAALKLKFPLKYADKDYIANFRKEVDDVRNLPIPENRIMQRKATLEAMVGKVPGIQEGAKSLEAYIKIAYPAGQVKSLLMDAGIAQNYAKIGKHQWDSVDTMLSGMLGFMSANKTTLETKGSMPTTFPGEITVLRTDFAALKKQFTDNDNLGKAETERAVNAINTLKDRITGILTDAKATFFKDKEKRESYNFTAFEQAVNPQKTAGGLRGGFVDAKNKRPVEGVKISTAYFGKVVFSDKKGRFVMHQLPKGKYTFIIEAKGYQTLTLTDIEIKTGVLKTLKLIALEPAPDSETPDVA